MPSPTSQRDAVSVRYADGVVRVTVSGPSNAGIVLQHVWRAMRAGLAATGDESSSGFHFEVTDDDVVALRSVRSAPDAEVVATVAEAAMEAFGYETHRALDYEPAIGQTPGR